MQHNVRLIDANAFKNVLRELANATDHPDEFDGIESCIRKIDSAPTVETTKETEKDSVDSVLARLPKEFEGSKRYKIEIIDLAIGEKPWACVARFGLFTNRESVTVYGETMMEAVKKLEASLNSK